ncbi:putative dual-specificity kinase [Helianthus annuus]|nr:putative dual-specificity kinase [Helianthus annuus]
MILYFSISNRISSKMGEGTFVQVLECLDNEKKEPVAIKDVRSINKYREAAMIEMDVLQKLASHDVGGSRLEVVKLKSIRSQAKVIGTLTTGLQEPCL